MRLLNTSVEPICDRRFRRLRLSVFALAAIIGAFLLTPTSASATCGDYLSHHHHFADIESSQLSDHDSLANPFTKHPPQQQSPQRKRCHGPSCQQAPLQAPLSPPVVTPEPQDRWGWMFHVNVPAPEASDFQTPLAEPNRSFALISRLDRPPKD